MKRLLLALALAVPALAQSQEVFRMTQTSGDLTIEGGQYVFRLPQFSQLDHSTAWVTISTTDTACNLYRMTVKYAYLSVPSRELSEVKYVPAVRLSAYGHTGDDKDQQAPVRVSLSLPVDVRVTEITVDKLKVEQLGTAGIQAN